MSTILKALKKIEKESPQNIDVSTVSPNMNSTQVLKQGIKKQRRQPLFFVSSAAVIVVLLTAWLVTSGILPSGLLFRSMTTPSDEAGPSTPVTPPGVPAVQKNTVPMVMHKKRVPVTRFAESPDQRQRAGLPDRKLPADRDVSSRHSLPDHPLRHADADESVRSPSVAAKVSPKVDLPAEPLPPDDIQSEIPLPAVKRVKSEDQNPPAPDKIADSSWLRLQAISWSSDSQSRMAVINDHIVREGAAVDGGVIYRIDKDYVVVRKAGEEWQVKFGLE